MAPPQLSASLLASGQFSLAWPPSADGFQLQTTTNLNSPWTNVGSGQVTINGLSNGLVSATLLPTDSPAFFRLMQP
jgi:hypothetical protein